jgi:hypothetical protein
MVSLTTLWLPILLSAAVVFFVSFVLHMLVPFHRSDFLKLPSEDEVMEALRRFSIPPGDYMAPSSTGPAAMRDPKFLEKMTKGPVVVATFLPGGPIRMGGQLAQWFVYCAIVGVFAAYIATRTLASGTDYLHVSQIVSCVAFVGYTLALWQQSIWYHRSWATTIRYTIDGLIYGFLTGGVFGWLWPK